PGRTGSRSVKGPARRWLRSSHTDRRPSGVGEGGLGETPALHRFQAGVPALPGFLGHLLQRLRREGLPEAAVGSRLQDLGDRVAVRQRSEGWSRGVDPAADDRAGRRGGVRHLVGLRQVLLEVILDAFAQAERDVLTLLEEGEAEQLRLLLVQVDRRAVLSL